MSYQEELKNAINLSFGYDYEELYNSLKDNVIPVDIIAIMIVGISKLVDRVNEDKETFHVLHLKDVSCAIQFINQMRFVYTEDMLETVKIKDSNGEVDSIQIGNGYGSSCDIKDYRNKINKIVHLSPFDFLLSLIGNSMKYQYHYKLLFNITRVCDSCLAGLDCFNCNKYKFHTKCECENFKEVGVC